MEEPSNYLQYESKTTLTPPVGKAETNAHETQGLDSNHVTLKERSLKSKENGLSRQDVSEKPGFSGLDTVSSRSKPESYKSSFQTLPADEVPDENNLVTENLLPLTAKSAAVVSGLKQDAERNGMVPSMEPSVSQFEHVPKNEPSMQTVKGSNDGTFSSSFEKVDETSPAPKANEISPVPNGERPLDKQITSGVITGLAADPVQLVGKNEMSAKRIEGGDDDAHSFTVNRVDEKSPVLELKHSFDNQVASVLATDMDVPQEMTGASIQRSLEGPALKNVSYVSEDPALEGATQNTNTTSGIPEDTTNIAAIAKDKEPKESSYAQKDREDINEACGITEGVVEPQAEEDMSRDLDSSDLNNSETHGFPRSESAVTALSEFGGSSHKFSDSFDEFFEDAQDTFETSSFGGSVEEDEGWDEPHQASGSSQGELKPLEAGTEESVVLLQNSTVSNNSSSVDTRSEEKAPTSPETSYGARTGSGELKAPSPAEAWQEPGPSNTTSKGKKPSTSEVIGDYKSGNSYTASRSSLTVLDKPTVENSTPPDDLKSPLKKDGPSSATANGKKTKSRSFWRSCVCCPTVQ